jgi:predicted ATPase
MKKYILTGTPGSGKTVLIRYIESIGHSVVEEAATDVICLAQACGEPEPWTKPDFIEKVVRLQIQRREKIGDATSVYQFVDRSPFCTLALANYLNYTPPPLLLDEIGLIKKENLYEKHVFFIENLGHCQPTEARKISFEEALRFEKIHEAVYLEHGFELIKIPNCPLIERAQLILSAAVGQA